RILTNKEIIALNQDGLGIQAMKYIHAGDLMVFAKPLENDEWGFLFLNRSNSPLDYTHDWNFFELKDDQFNRNIDFTKVKFTWTDLWKGNNGDTINPLKLQIPANDVVVLRLVPKK